jgi:hypothetical protein
MGLGRHQIGNSCHCSAHWADTCRDREVKGQIIRLVVDLWGSFIHCCFAALAANERRSKIDRKPSYFQWNEEMPKLR